MRSINKKITYFTALMVIMIIFGVFWHTKYTSKYTKEEPIKYKSALTTMFWVGEDSDESNGFIPNHESYWDSFWLEHYGGIDSPDNRCGYQPCKFIPKENPFYFALPYGDRDNNENLKESVKLIPWYKNISKDESLIKNVWIEIKYNNKICYAQWEDVGPFETDDFDYVFGNAAPKNIFGVSAGLDISPATWDCLGIDDNAIVKWRFVEEKDVPEGPWKLIITSSGISF
jgi:hypothetical protein